MVSTAEVLYEVFLVAHLCRPLPGPLTCLLLVIESRCMDANVAQKIWPQIIPQGSR